MCTSFYKKKYFSKQEFTKSVLEISRLLNLVQSYPPKQTEVKMISCHLDPRLKKIYRDEHVEKRFKNNIKYYAEIALLFDNPLWPKTECTPNSWKRWGKSCVTMALIRCFQ